MVTIRAERIRFALPFAVGYWLLLVLFQCENFLGFLRPKTTPGMTPARFFLTLPTLQMENVFAAVMVGLVACVLSGWVVWRWVMLALWVGVSCYLVFNQVYYKVFFDHFRPSSIEGVGEFRSTPLFGSILYELDPVFFFNDVVVVWSAAFLVWRCTSVPEAPLPPARARRDAWLLAAGAAILFVVGIPNVFSSAYRNVQHHPLLVLADDATRRSLIEDLRRGRAPSPAVAERAGASSLPKERDPRMAEVLRACRGGSRPPSLLA
jgi:hypothetical protein